MAGAELAKVVDSGNNFENRCIFRYLDRVGSRAKHVTLDVKTNNQDARVAMMSVQAICDHHRLVPYKSLTNSAYAFVAAI